MRLRNCERKGFVDQLDGPTPLNPATNATSIGSTPAFSPPLQFSGTSDRSHSARSDGDDGALVCRNSSWEQVVLNSSMTGLTLTIALAVGQCSVAHAAAEEEIVQMLQHERPYHTVAPEQFEKLGWELPDGGAAVKAIAGAAPGSAFDPCKLETLSPERLGYRARWHELRYEANGLPWDIAGLHLIPNQPLAGIPTLVIVHGGASNWYEFFVDPLNQPGIAQYLAQKVPVLLVTIPGNYRHGGWTENEYAQRVPGYLLDRDVSADELRIRNAVYTFRVVTDGVKELVESVTTGPVVIVGHSTGGEIQFILHGSALKSRMNGLSLGWGSGGPAGLDVMQELRGFGTAEDYLDVWELRPRPPEDYAGSYLGPLNPVWDPNEPRSTVAEHWMDLEQRRRPNFKQPLQNIEHRSAINLRNHVAGQIRQTLNSNALGIDPDEVIEQLFSTMRAPLTGYRKMIWTTARLDLGHWDEDLSEARELQVANEFREKNPDVPIRVLLFDVPMTHYGHVEKPRQLAGALLAAIEWLVQP